jgi:hypothetical protein
MPFNLHAQNADSRPTDLLSAHRRDVQGLNGLDVIEHHLPDSIAMADFLDLLAQVSSR